MKIRNYEKLTLNLPQLQDHIKRDAESYKSEFLIQLEHYNSMYEMFKLNPSTNLKDFSQMVTFLAHISHCYVHELKQFAEQLITILKSYASVIHPEIRASICKSLVLLRNKKLLSTTDLLSTFFDLFHCQDKMLREYLKQQIANDIRQLNICDRDLKRNAVVQSYVFSKLKENSITSAKAAIDIMILLYRKNIWNDAKTVNKIAECCFSKHNKLMVAALCFFIGREDDKDNDDDEDGGAKNKKSKCLDSDSESEREDKTKAIRQMLSSNKVNKKTRRRKKLFEKTTKLVNAEKKKSKVPIFNFSALHLIYDPQEMAERLLRQLEKSTERYEVKLLMMDLISRLIGVHQLMVLNFYPFIQRYLQPHQKDVTKILLFVSQASHELVLPDVLENLIKHVAFNFITERNSPECMAVGLNTVREILARCPLAISQDLLQDFAEYKTYTNKNVSTAAKSLIQLFRVINPSMLKNRDRGRKTIAAAEAKEKAYGELDAKGYLPGAELLDMAENIEPEEDMADHKKMKKVKQNEGDTDNSDSEFEDYEGFSDLESEYEEEEEDDESGESQDEEQGDIKTGIKEKSAKSNIKTDKKQAASKETETAESPEDIKARAELICSTRILGQEEFQKLKAIRLAKQVKAVKSVNTKRKQEAILLESDLLQPKELVSLSAIERLYKRPKMSKEERTQKESKGRQHASRGGWRQNKAASKTEAERQRNKAFMMIKHKANRKKKTSFRGKQQQVRAAIIKQLKAKKL